MSGFFLMQRDVFEHHLFKGSHERFYAWSWLIAKAAWQKTQFDVGGKTITLERGQLCYSIRRLSEKWGMSKGATERFINRLKTETMIETASGRGRLIITICNYDDYQTAEKLKRDTKRDKVGTKLGQSWDTKYTLEPLERKEEEGSIDPPPELFSLTEVEQAPRVTSDNVMEAFNSVAEDVGLPKAEKWTAKRKKLIGPFLKNNSMEQIMRALDNLRASKFCRGENDRGWKMDFDDFLHEEKFTKLMEGKYG